MLMQRIKRHADWWFKDLTVRKGQYVIAETPTLPLVVFAVSIFISIITYKGFVHVTATLIAYAAVTYWGVIEVRTGKSRFRKLLGIMAIIAVAGALLMRMGLG